MSRSWLSTGLLFVLLTLGYALVHLIFAIWVGALLQPFQTEATISESVQITKAGEAFIKRNIRRPGEPSQSPSEFYRLDGTPVPSRQTPSQFMDLESLSPSPSAPKTTRLPPWSERMVIIRDAGSPPTFWYLEISPDNPQQLFLAGYNSVSRRRIGYLGRDGFHPNPVPRESCFLIPRTGDYHVWKGAVASSHAQSWEYDDKTHEPPGGEYRPTPHFANVEDIRLWILSEGTVYEIDLLRRQVKPLIQAGDAIALNQTEVVRDGRQLLQLLLRTQQQLHIIDPQTLADTRLPLPLLPPPCTGTFYGVATNGERILMSAFQDRVDLSQPQSYEIQWFHPDGTPARTETCTLARTPEVSISSVNLNLALPTPLVPLFGLAIGPSAMAWDGDPRDYATRFQRMLDLTGTWLFVALAIGLACGYACRRREVQIYGNRAWLWPIVVGLCGWFGWIGYICLRPLPARLPDGKYLPRIPEPALPTGYEILA